MARRAFTLVQLLFVFGIILILAGILFPVFTQVKARAKITECQSHLHQVGLGIQMYRTDNDGQAWLQFNDASGGYTTAGRFRYPWNDWLPVAPYLTSGNLVWCPLPGRDEITAYNHYHLNVITNPVVANAHSITVWHPYNPEPGRVVAWCSNHTINVLEKPDPLLSSMVELWKGIYPVVREDGSSRIVKSSEIQLWYLWPDNTWHLMEKGTLPSSQAWRFPGEPWPPSLPF